MTFHLDTLAYTNQLRHLPPQQKLLFGLVMLGVALVSHWPVQILITAWMAWWCLVYARISPRVYGELFVVATGFLLIGLVALVLNIVSSSEIPQIAADQLTGQAWGDWYIYVSGQGVAQAFRIFWRSLAAIATLLFLLCTVPVTQALAVARQWHLPASLADVILLMYRFIFIIFATFQDLSQAQTARCGYVSWAAQWRSAKLLAGQLLIRSLQQYQRFSLGLATRGFVGHFQVDGGVARPLNRRYALEAILGVGVLSGMELSYRLQGWG